MIQQILAIRDQAVDAFGRPMFVPAIGAGIRAFSDAVNDGKSEYAQHPEDYELFHLGSYDDATGKFVQLDQPKSIALGRNLVTKPKGE